MPTIGKEVYLKSFHQIVLEPRLTPGWRCERGHSSGGCHAARQVQFPVSSQIIDGVCVQPDLPIRTISVFEQHMFLKYNHIFQNYRRNIYLIKCHFKQSVKFIFKKSQNNLRSGKTKPYCLCWKKWLLLPLWPQDLDGQVQVSFFSDKEPRYKYHF